MDNEITSGNWIHMLVFLLGEWRNSWHFVSWGLSK